MCENQNCFNTKDKSDLSLAVWAYYWDPLYEKEKEKEVAHRNLRKWELRQFFIYKHQLLNMIYLLATNFNEMANCATAFLFHIRPILPSYFWHFHVNVKNFLDLKLMPPNLICCFNPLTTRVPNRMETSRLICIANQLTGFYVMENISW